MPGLLCTEQTAGTADFQIAHGNFNTGTESRKIPDSIKAFFSIFCEHLITAERQIGACTPGRPADSAANLMQLSQTEMIGIFNNQSIDIGDVNSGFNNGCTDQNLDISAHHAIHHIGKQLLVHTAVSNTDRYLTAEQRGYFAGCTLNVINTVMEIINLAAALKFPHHGICQNIPVMFQNKGLNGETVFRRLLNGGHIPYSGKGHIHGSGDRSGRERQNIHTAGEFLDVFLMRNAETLLLIHDEKTEVFKRYIFGKKAVCTDHKIALAGGQIFQNSG